MPHCSKGVQEIEMRWHRQAQMQEAWYRELLEGPGTFIISLLWNSHLLTVLDSSAGTSSAAHAGLICTKTLKIRRCVDRPTLEGTQASRGSIWTDSL